MNKLYLTGLPGAGKTETGKWLAEKLGWKFIDLDDLIETQAGQSIADIFSGSGEEYFRKLESEILRKTVAMAPCVVSCGGGTPEWHENMDWMNRNGLTVYLNPDIETIAARLAADKKPRPMFSGLKKDAIRKKLNEISDRRMPFYSRSKVVWNKNKPDENFYLSLNKLLAFYKSPA
jgi:shikimate kinase